MPKIILAHLALFAGLFGVVMPGLSGFSAGSVDFHGGVVAFAVMIVLSEAVVVCGVFYGTIFQDFLCINAMLQRKTALVVSIVVLTLAYAYFLRASSAVVPAVITVTWWPAVLLAVGVTIALYGFACARRGFLTR